MLKCSNDDKYYTQTSQGKIWHLNAKIGGFELCMPVKLKADLRGQPAPMKDQHGWVYALPAGGQINLNGDRSWPR